MLSKKLTHACKNAYTSLKNLKQLMQPAWPLNAKNAAAAALV